jgi:Lon protease-like protein
MSAALRQSLPLFPLQTVLFPGGLLNLKVFEARYLDLIGRCMREQGAFGVVALRQGADATAQAAHPSVPLEDCGVSAELLDVDSPQTGILQVRCRGGDRFTVVARRQQADGLWIGDIEPLEADDRVVPDMALLGSVRGLANAIARLREQGNLPFLEPYRFDDAGWVANRWCEILPISLAAKQKLMALDDPQVRLQLVDEFLRGQGVVS